MPGKRLSKARHCFLRKDQHEKTKLGFTVRDALEYLFNDVTGDSSPGVIKSESHTQSILRGALLLYGTGQLDDARDLANVIYSGEVLKDNLEILVRQYLKLEEFSLPG